MLGRITGWERWRLLGIEDSISLVGVVHLTFEWLQPFLLWLSLYYVLPWLVDYGKAI